MDTTRLTVPVCCTSVTMPFLIGKILYTNTANHWNKFMVHSLLTDKSRIILKTSVCAVILLMILQVAFPLSAGTSHTGKPAGTPGTDNAPYSTSIYQVVFRESGLPSSPTGQLWTVNLSGKISKSSTDEITFNVSQGTYHYNVTTSQGFQATPGSGSVNVSGANVLVSVVFSSTLFTVTFNETGLGTQSVPGETTIPLWSVTFDGISQSAAARNISFTVPTGNYAYAVFPPSGYYILSKTGTISVANANVLVSLSFASSRYEAVFNETGLPMSGTGSLWNVTIVNSTHAVFRQSSINSTIGVTLPNGTYTYTISGLGMYIPNPETGTFTISGGNYYQRVNFASGLYVANFTESGLPVGDGNAPVWGVTLINSSSGQILTQFSNSTSIEFSLPNGLYSYSIIPAKNFTTHSFSGTGTLKLNREPQRVLIHFVPNYFKVEFIENGLPSFNSENTLWAVKMGGVVENSSSSEIYFTEPIPAVAKKIYYTVLPVADFRVNGTNTGSVYTGNYSNNDTEGSVTFHVTFNYTNEPKVSYNTTSGKNVFPYLVFYETGLPSSTQWSVGLNNTSYRVHALLSSSFSEIYYNQTKGVTVKLYFSVFSTDGYVPVVNSSGTVYWDGVNYTNISVVFVKEIHSIQFNESGLPAGTSWSVSLYYPNGTFKAYTSLYEDSSIINLSNGLYYYQVGMPAGFRPFSPEGSIYVNNSSRVISPSSTILFVRALETLTFYETGLPSSAAWSVNLTNGTVSRSETGNAFEPITFQVPNGTYYYQSAYKTGSTYLSYNSGGFVWLDSSASRTLIFHSTLRQVTFSETGLPLGQSFQVILNGISENSGGFQAVSFNLPNGTYYFTVQTSFPFAARESSGFVTVKGASFTENITFYNYSHVLTVNSVGLPPGTTWNFILGGKIYSSSSASISILLGNGTYSYYLETAVNVFTYFPSPSGGFFNISGSNMTISIVFEDFVYHVLFEESGLPVGSLWSLTFAGKIYSTNSTQISIVVQNGTYSYTISKYDEFTPTPYSGSVKVSGTSQTINISFYAFMNKVTFKENGLPTGFKWGLVLRGQYNFSNATYTVNSTTFNLPNGTYLYAPYSTNLTWRAPPGGTFTLKGTGKVVLLNFTEVVYTVSFKETGLPTNTSWTVNLNGENSTSTLIWNNFTVPNGTYAYVIYNTSGYHITSVSTGTLLVNGTSVTIPVSFAKNVPPPPPPAPTPTPSKAPLITPTELYLIIGVIAIAGVAAAGVYVMRKRRKEE